MPQQFGPGDFLIFQLEAAFALLRVLAIDERDGKTVWHLAAYRQFFADVETAETAIACPSALSLGLHHVALTDRAFESTQVAKIGNKPLTDAEAAPVGQWRNAPEPSVSDRSIRLVLGLR